MADDNSTNLSSAFDALLDKNWRSLDELSGQPTQPTVQHKASTPPAQATGTGHQSGRKSGRSDGIDFTFDL
ncbi:MAG: hypothetical protein OSB58_17890 [Alphaproteobacteria bacterium]|jgi:hypothetical protein|nr:hypothetical protein [Alphaproteobacteria bacterium]